MNRILLAIGGLLVGLLAVMFAAPTMVDWNRYRGIFEEEASRFLGREVRVGGRVNLRLLPVPYVQFEQVRVADTTANVGRPLFKADDFTIWLSIGSLLAGNLEASDIELRRPVVTLVLDGKGGGSWASLAGDRPTGILSPGRIAFDAVRITDGSIAILSPQGESRATIEHIKGELSAQALEGPYRVAAAFTLGGGARDIRLSTAKAGADGSVRFKGTVRDPASGVSYSLDGTAADVLGNISVHGEVTARLPLPAALAAAPTAAQPKSELDLKAALKGDTTGFSLSDLALSFEQAGRPQLATGKAKVTWGQRTDVAVEMRSHWLDLDRVAGAGTGGAPLELAQSVVGALSRALATQGRTEATIGIDQATLGSDVVSNLTATLEHANGKLNVKSLAASLPGGARLSATGAFEGSDASLRYEGRVNLRGASFSRFLGWAARGQRPMVPARDGPFTIVGDLSLGPREVAGRNLTLEIGRNLLTGSASWKDGKPQQIGLNLEGSELDLTPLVAAEAEPAQAIRDLIAALAGAKAAGAAPGVSAADADIRLRVDRLVVGPTAFRDATAELKLAGGNLSMPQLRLVSDDGYSIDLRGDIADLAKAGAKGVLTGLVTAEQTTAVTRLATIVGLPADLVPSEADARLLAPLRLAGRLSVGVRGAESHDLAMDGTLAGNRVAGTLRLGPQAKSWRERPTDMALTIEGSGIAQLVARGLGTAPDKRISSSTGARLDVRGVGVPKTGVTALVAVTGAGLAAEYRGRAKLDDGGAVGLAGELSLALDDLPKALDLVGLATRPGLEGPVAGTVTIERAEARTKLASERLRIAGAEARGTLIVEPIATGQRFSGDVVLDRAGLTRLFTLLTAAPPPARREGERRSPWSEAPLDLAVLERLAGSRVRLETGRLALAPGIELGEARLEIAVQATGLELRLHEAKAAGGQASGRLTLDKAPAGARVTVEAGLVGARIERMAVKSGAQPAAAGGLSIVGKAESTALTPRGLIVALTGSGEVALSQARLNRLDPSIIHTAGETVLAIKGEIPSGALRLQIEQAMQAAGIGIGTHRLPLTIADGAARVTPLVATAQHGRITGRATIDLDHLQIDGEWRLEPRNSPQAADMPPKPELPGISVAYSGSLATLSLLEPRLDIEALEREIAVRKVEREVAELERLRRLDEERARQEMQRREGEERRLEAPAVPSQPTVPATAAPQAVLPSAPAAGPGVTPSTAAGTSAVPPQPSAVEQGAASASAVEQEPGASAAGIPAPRPAAGPTRSGQNRDPFRSMRDSTP